MVRKLLWRFGSNIACGDMRYPKLVGETQKQWEDRVIDLFISDVQIDASAIIGWYSSEELPKCPSEYWQIVNGKITAPPTAMDDYKNKQVLSNRREVAQRLMMNLQTAKMLEDLEWEKEILKEIKELKERRNGI